MPPPSKRPGRKDVVPEVIRPSWLRKAQPVVVPRSRARMQVAERHPCSRCRSAVWMVGVMLKAHGSWAFGFGHGQRIMTRAPIQEKCARRCFCPTWSRVVPLVEQSGTPNFPFKTRRVPPVPLVPPLSLRRMRKNEVGGDTCAPYGKERSWRSKWDRWDRIDFKWFFPSHLGLEVGHAAKWDSGKRKGAPGWMPLRCLTLPSRCQPLCDLR